MIDGALQVLEVLLVDDEEAWLRSLSMALRVSGGLRVRRCSDSRLVMDLLAEGTIRLVLLDLNMPHVSGVELLPRLVEEHPDVPVIVLTGLNQVETAPLRRAARGPPSRPSSRRLPRRSSRGERRPSSRAVR